MEYITLKADKLFSQPEKRLLISLKANAPSPQPSEEKEK